MDGFSVLKTWNFWDLPFFGISRFLRPQKSLIVHLDHDSLGHLLLFWSLFSPSLQGVMNRKRMGVKFGISCIFWPVEGSFRWYGFVEKWWMRTIFLARWRCIFPKTWSLLHPFVASWEVQQGVMSRPRGARFGASACRSCDGDYWRESSGAR